jgi:hypothetical protein
MEGIVHPHSSPLLARVESSTIKGEGTKEGVQSGIPSGRGFGGVPQM